MAVILGDVPRGTTAAEARRPRAPADARQRRHAAEPGPRRAGQGVRLLPVEAGDGVLAVRGDARRAGRRLARRARPPAAPHDAQRAGAAHLVGDPDAGAEMHFSFFDLIAHVARTRAFCAGTILGSGTVSNADPARGVSCLAERARDRDHRPAARRSRRSWRAGDAIAIEMRDAGGRDLFGRIDAAGGEPGDLLRLLALELGLAGAHRARLQGDLRRAAGGQPGAGRRAQHSADVPRAQPDGPGAGAGDRRGAARRAPSPSRGDPRLPRGAVPVAAAAARRSLAARARPPARRDGELRDPAVPEPVAARSTCSDAVWPSRRSSRATSSRAAWRRSRRSPARRPGPSWSATRRRIADVYLVPQLYSARRFGVDLAPFPTLLRVEAACAALPAFAAAHPDVQARRARRLEIVTRAVATPRNSKLGGRQPVGAVPCWPEACSAVGHEDEGSPRCRLIRSPRHRCRPAASNGGSSPVPSRSRRSRATRADRPGRRRRQLASDNRAFAVSLYQTLRAAAGSDDNLIFSQTSISLALAMLYGGAANDTAAADGDGPRTSRCRPSACTRRSTPLDLALTTPPAGGGCRARSAWRIANSTWAQQGLRLPARLPRSRWPRTTARASIVEDFAGAPEPARAAINGWVSDQTEDMIPSCFRRGRSPRDTRLVLANAVFFHGDWVTPVQAAERANGTFHAPTGDVSVPMMTPRRGQRDLVWSGSRVERRRSPLRRRHDRRWCWSSPTRGPSTAFEQGLTADGLATILAPTPPHAAP